MWKKRVLAGLGIMFVVIGMIGIILPLLPTTPFLLLAATCFVKSSPRLYDWLLNNKIFGTYIRNYRENKGIPLRVKIIALLFLWFSIGYSFFFVLENIHGRVFLVIIVIGVTTHILMMKTLKKE